MNDLDDEWMAGSRGVKQAGIPAAWPGALRRLL
jgi:hypothetical protein